ncbi:MAG: PilZ domain-containing protein [Candidatus Omnitrophica bacterium]|nr:PilZ domain-containing protein [Candidatus Omnitrophota bacterium]
MDERRIKPRWQINQGAELTVEDGVKAIHCVVEDISPAGMRISLNRNLFDEVFTDFNLVLDEDFEFNVSAHVAWRDAAYEKNIYGLSFNRIDESVKNGISEYVKKNFPGVLVKQWWKGI